MAPRKPIPTIIRRDSEFTARLVTKPSSDLSALGATLRNMDPNSPIGSRKYKPAALEPMPKPAEVAQSDAAPEVKSAFAATTIEPTAIEPVAIEPVAIAPAEPQTRRKSPTVIVNIGVSLSAETAERAQAWADAGKVEPKTLIRKIAKTHGPLIVAAWRAHGFSSGQDDTKRGHLTTTVPVTLPADMAQALEKEHDPLELLSLGRIISGPYRKAYEEAFIAAAQAAGF